MPSRWKISLKPICIACWVIMPSITAAPRYTSTDADAIFFSRAGVAAALVSVPNRYMHSPNELVSLDDVDRAASLIAEACRRVSDATDFTDR